MRKLVAVLALTAAVVATVAWAGESGTATSPLLGKLVVSDAGTTTNRCTGWAAYAGGGAFVVPPLAKISVQCDSAAYFLTDVAGCDAGNCVKLAADQFFTSTINGSKTLTCYAFNSDAGIIGVPVTYTGGWVSMAPVGASATCRVWSRKGDE